MTRTRRVPIRLHQGSGELLTGAQVLAEVRYAVQEYATEQEVRPGEWLRSGFREYDPRITVIRATDPHALWDAVTVTLRLEDGSQLTLIAKSRRLTFGVGGGGDVVTYVASGAINPPPSGT